MYCSKHSSAKGLIWATMLVGTMALSACGGGAGSSSTFPAVPAVGPAGDTGLGAPSLEASGAAPPASRSTMALATNGTALAVPNVAAAATSGPYASNILSAKPLGYYQLSDATSKLVDSSNHSVSGTYGSAVIRQTEAVTAGAASAAGFPGGSSYNSNGYAYTPRNAALQPATVSLEVWIKLDAPNATNHDIPVVVYGTVGRGVRYGLWIHGLGAGKQCFLYQQHNLGAVPFAVHGTTDLLVGSIYHIVTTSDGQTVRTYVNGVPETATAYAGSIDYSATFSDGLQIGGANQIPAYAGASFPGTIGQVAVYSGALSASQVTSHFLAGQSIPMVTEAAASSDAFVDSIGLNAKFDNEYSTYGTHFAQVKNLLVDLGVRHLREAMSWNYSGYFTMMKELAASGIRASYLTQLKTTQSQVQQFPSLVGNSFELYEAPNEQDDVGNANWLPQCRAFEQTLYGWVKSNPATARFPVLGPAIVGRTDIISLGNLSAYLDYGNLHDYFNVFNPGTPGWGGTYPPYGGYGAIDYNVNLAHVIGGTKPVISTETGYGTIAGNPLTLDYRTDLRYMTRLFFEQFNGGVSRTYSYEFLDDGSGLFNNFGIVQSNLVPKPAYYGLQSIISVLKDPGSSFQTTPLTYQFTGFINSVHHTLMQKRNGQYVLAVWLELPGWVTAGNVGGDIIVPGQTITLTTAKHFSTASQWTMDDGGHFTLSPLSWNGTSATMEVTDKITLINLGP